MTPPNPDYPVRLEVEYPARLSRLLIFVKWLLAIPHLIALMVLGIGALFVLVIAWFAVLFTGRYPAGMFNYLVGVLRWGRPSERVPPAAHRQLSAILAR